MAVAAYKTYASGETLTASDLNASFSQIHDNGESLGWPATASKDLDGQKLVLDSDGDSSIHASTDDQIDVEVLGFDAIRVIGVASAVNGVDIKPSATTNAITFTARGSDTDISINMVPKGAGVFTVGGSELFSSPMTTRGDIITQGASAAQRTAVGAANEVLYSDGTDPTWGNVTGAMIAFGSDARGDIAYRNATTWARLAIGTANKVLKTDGTDPSWANVSGPMIVMGSDARGDIIYRNASNYARLAVGSANQVLSSDGTDPAWSSTPFGTSSIADNPGYVRLPGGLIFQWGEIACSGDSSATDSFGLTFPTAVFGAVASLRENSNVASAGYVDSFTTSQIVVRNGTSGSATVHWLAWGN